MLDSNILGLDVGEVRVGVSLVRADVLVPVAVTTLARQAEDFWQQLTGLISEHSVRQLVIGLPRNLDGQETAQTAAAQAFGVELQQHTALPIAWQDEALTSVKAEESLKASGKIYQKADIDSLAACFILTDYIEASKVRR